MAVCASAGKHLLAECDRAFAKFAIERDIKRGGAAQATCLPEIGWSRRHQKGDQIFETVLDGAKACTVAPALADLERRLSIVALSRIDCAQIGHMVDPALLGAGGDVEIDPLDRVRRANRILAAFEDI